ncbi:hypothetical protein NCS57_00666200 [Fusarium keratoplasticum]|uniref:Uncharacterized protein n=1 Tax=Fusarium keratoplasticum TaxID=1328300 RepID=A0ACC0R3Z8_9HYPO|nr:hypothetical protein NCS57_00666200 [Fusarium keratoplasticum]KAI8671897.1 hypothetical protein NCS57_00666200 [Fusarium keratoplasticum]KAI8679110.1 hypothetical protein NCS55_00634100 [Fusarium keratoplasticum]
MQSRPHPKFYMPGEWLFKSSTLQSQPHARFYMPAEWSNHSHTLMVWPDSASIPWPYHEAIHSARYEVSAIANAISHFQPVTMYARPHNVSRAKDTVSERVTVCPLEAWHLWVRDTGPTFVQNISDGSPTGLSMNFNYWGAKLPREGDDGVVSRILSRMDVPVITAPFKAEGGAIEVDGEGTLLATESAILNANRNPGISKEAVEEHFRKFLGVKKTIWFRGVKGHDIADYHIDAFARFLSPGVVLLSRPPKTAQEILRAAYEQAREVIQQETDAQGRHLEVVELAEPPTEVLAGDHYGNTVASYANYLLVNGGVIMPRFGVGEEDLDAFELFRRRFPGREVVQIYLNTLPKLGGGIHSATQQVPLR